LCDDDEVKVAYNLYQRIKLGFTGYTEAVGAEMEDLIMQIAEKDKNP
jgi:hypothetical protein